MTEYRINSSAAALLATSIAVRAVETLRDKGVITNEEGMQLYENALSHIPDETENAEARLILNVFMPAAAF